MAEMNIPVNESNKRSKKLSTRVDLTAMVDLGFLLITFFMLATTMNMPKIIEVNKPVRDEISETVLPSIMKSKTITLMLGDNNKIYWYVAPNNIKTESDIILDSCDYSANGLRKVIKKRLKEVLDKHGLEKDGANPLFVMIKPLPGSTLKNTVDVLDEMEICDVKKFAILPVKEDVDMFVANRVGQNIN